MKKLYINYLKPWTIIIVFMVLLSSSFFSCKEEEEVPEIPVCTLSPPNVSVESEKGSVILLDGKACILSESDKLWEGIPGKKSIIYPREINFEIGPVDLSNSVGKRLKFSGVLDLIRRDTLTIEGVRQSVCVCDIRDYDLQFTGGSRTSVSSDQIICGTEYSSQNYMSLLSLSRSAQNIDDTNPYIRLYVSVLRTTAGIGLDKEYVANTILNNLNSTYTSTGIQFVLVGNRYLDIIDNALYNKAADKAEQDNIYNKYNHSDALDVFVFSVGNNNLGNGILAGRAHDIPSTACFIFSSYYADETVAHEVGHCLGLFHTHHGTSLHERDANTIPELVNGSNSTYSGDYIADTPADPCTWTKGLFVDFGLRDSNGEIYRPDPYNIMSYSHITDYLPVSQKFTLMQAERMHTFLNTSSTKLKNIIDRRELPSKHLRAGDTISIKYLRPTDAVQWTITNMPNEERPPHRIRKIENPKTSNDRYLVTSTEESEFYDLIANVTTAEGKTFELTAQVTSGAPNPDMGMIQWMTEYEVKEDYETGRPEEEGRYGTSYEDGLSYSDNINVYGNTTIDLSFFDLACGPIPCTFRCVTSTNRVIEDNRFTVSPADCENGYLEIYVKDQYGQMDDMRAFAISVRAHGRYYAARVKDGKITFEGRLGDEYLKNSESAPKISKIEVYNKAGKLILNESRQKASVAALSLTPLAKGTYKAVVSDDNSFSQEILFEI